MHMNNVFIAGTPPTHTPIHTPSAVSVVFSLPSWPGHRGHSAHYVTVSGEVWVHVPFSSSINGTNCLTTTMGQLRGPSAHARSGDNYLNMKLSLSSPLSGSPHLPASIRCSTAAAAGRRTVIGEIDSFFPKLIHLTCSIRSIFIKLDKCLRGTLLILQFNLLICCFIVGK